MWAKLDRAPLAFALEQLERLAKLTSGGPGGDGVGDLVSAYVETGWQADDAFLAALGAAPETADRAAVAGAASALYRPWVDAHARALQAAIGPAANSGTYSPAPEAATTKGTVNVFVDGLRLDLAHRLADRLGSLEVEVETVLAALPTITPTAKPAVTPLPPGAVAPGKDLGLVRASSGAKANINMVRGLHGGARPAGARGRRHRRSDAVQRGPKRPTSMSAVTSLALPSSTRSTGSSTTSQSA